jgi:hypothetical protein
MKRTITTAFLGMALAASTALAQTPAKPANDTTGVGGSGSFSGWLSDYQTKHEGRISRQAYMDEVARRWDLADKDRKGLTSDQIHQTYGMGGPAGTNPAPGNMGPTNVKK